jgi:hypothetical protein
MKKYRTITNEYRENFKRLSKFGYTFDEVENKYFILYHKMNKVLTFELMHKDKKILIFCFDEYLNDFLSFLLSKNLDSDTIMTNLLRLHQAVVSKK